MSPEGKQLAVGCVDTKAYPRFVHWRGFVLVLCVPRSAGTLLSPSSCSVRAVRVVVFSRICVRAVRSCVIGGFLCGFVDFRSYILKRQRETLEKHKCGYRVLLVDTDAYLEVLV